VLVTTINEKKMSKEYDVIIIGGGLIGISLALTLAQASLKIAVVDAAVSSADHFQSEQTLVLAYSSRVIFESIGIWSRLAGSTCPVHQICVSDQGHWGSSQITAAEEKISALGYVLSAGSLAGILYSFLNKQPNITLLQPAKFSSYQHHTTGVTVYVDQDNTPLVLSGKLLVACDGQNSAVRQYLNVSVNTYDYEQLALISHIQLKRHHQHIAYERFTAQGPLAMLPLTQERCALIWTVTPSFADRLLSLSSAQFIQMLQKSFGYRLGKLLACNQPMAIPLKLAIALQQIFPGVVLLGNAVHTLHPVAGQGLNLGLRDMAVLAQEVVSAHRRQQPLGSVTLLEKYWQQRKQDQEQIIQLTHSLIGLFSNSFLPMVMARNGGLLLMDQVNIFNKILTKKTLGWTGKVPRLACGMNLE
jgi:2-octaprenyl-6-methoxyphenol hydroxylase